MFIYKLLVGGVGAPVGKKTPQDLSDGGENGANRGDRTHDLRITNAPLYQLSYVGKTDWNRTTAEAYNTLDIYQTV